MSHADAQLRRQLELCNTRRQSVCLRYEDVFLHQYEWLLALQKQFALRPRKGFPFVVSHMQGDSCQQACFVILDRAQSRYERHTGVMRVTSINLNCQPLPHQAFHEHKLCHNACIKIVLSRDDLLMHAEASGQASLSALFNAVDTKL